MIKQRAQNLGFERKAVEEIRLAVIEACINAWEHSESPDRRIYLNFLCDQDKMLVMVRDFGHWRHEPSTRDDPSGTGLRLMRSLMDDVQLKRTEGGTFVHMQRVLRRDVSRKDSVGSSVGRVSRLSRGIVEAR